MPAPTDNIIQHAAQSMTPEHWFIVLGIIAGAMLVALVICIHGVWQEVRRGEQQLQHDLERSESRAKAGGHEHL